MKKIIYLHGLGSSGATQTADYLRNKLPEVEVISPDIPLHSEEALQMLNKLCYELKPDVIVGTSMGAMYAQQLHGYKKILVNPAFHVSEIMRKNLGQNKWFNPRNDGQTEFVIDEELCDLYQQMEESQFDGITEFDKKHTRAFFGTEDTLVNGYDEYMQNYTVATPYPGEHRLLQKWVKEFILPCIQELLEEERDNENVSAVRTNELLLSISDGGKRGRMAYYELLKAYTKLWVSVATNYYEGVGAVMEVAREGFQKIVKSYVYEYEDMPKKCFSKVLYQQLHEYFKSEVKRRRFNKLASEGSELDSLYAMRLLTRLYIENCGISLGIRTIAYYCGWKWLERYNDEHPEESRWDKDSPFDEVMPIICDDYKEELYGDYDVTYIPCKEQISFVMPHCTSDDDLTKALCWALHRQEREEHLKCLYLLIEVRLQENLQLDTTRRAIFYNKEDAEKEMEKWTEHGRRNLLCFVIRELPREREYKDEFKVTTDSHTEPIIDADGLTEYIYMPTGFERKFTFKEGDAVEYIYYDRETRMLKKGRIVKTHSSDEGYYSIQSLEPSEQCVMVPSQYVFPLNHLQQ